MDSWAWLVLASLAVYGLARLWGGGPPPPGPGWDPDLENAKRAQEVHMPEES